MKRPRRCGFHCRIGERCALQGVKPWICNRNGSSDKPKQLLPRGGKAAITRYIIHTNKGGRTNVNKSVLSNSEIGAGKTGFSKTRSIIEAAFYGNNVVKINTLKEAYDLAKNSPGTVVTDMPIYRGDEIGLERDSKFFCSTTAQLRAVMQEHAVSKANLV